MSDKTLKQKQQRQDKEKQAYAFYVAQGWTPEQAIGIVGNLIRESNLNTTIVGTADDKGSQGVAQWHSKRLKTLKDRYGDKWTDFRNQLEFVDWELKNTEKAAGDKLKASKGIWEAGKIVSDSYERPKVKFSGDEKRQSHVADLARKFKGVKITAEDMPYYEANYATSVAPFMNQQKETVTPTLNYFDIPKETTTFASVPDSAEKEETTEKIDKYVAEVEQKTKEYNFLEELQKEDYSHLQPQQLAQQQNVPQVDFNQQYEQVSQFIDEPLVAQQGLTWQEKLANRPKKPTVAEIIAEGDVRKAQQRVQIDNTKVSSYNNARLFNPNVRNKTDKEIAQEREARIQASVEAQKTPYTKENWRQQLAAETSATGDKLRISLEPNFFDDYVNPASMIGSMASNLGQAPLQAEQSDSVMPYITAIGTPLITGALAGIGAKTTGQFANNIVNPLAGLKTGTSNYFTNPTEKVTTSLKDNLKSFFTGRDIMKPSNLIPKEELDNIINRELNYIKSKEYITNRVKNTGEKIEDVEKEISQYEKYLDDAQINIDESVSGGSYYRPSNVVRAGAKGKSTEYTKGVVQHEVNHLLSPTGLNEKAYKNFPIIDFEPKFSVGNKKYNMLPEEQQVRNNKIKTYMEDIYGKKRGSEFNDEDIKNLLGENDFNSIDDNPYYEDASNFIKDIKHSNPTKYKDLLKDTLNKSWATLPIAGASYLATQGQEEPKKLQQGGEFSENELAFLSEIAIKDNNGYWDKNNQGKVVEIQGGNISMENVDQDLIGIGINKKGKKTEQKTMKAGKNYNFDKAIKVIEIPLFKK